MSLIQSPDCYGSHPSKCVTFYLQSAKSFYKVFCQETKLGDALKEMMISKAVPKGRMSVECEHGVRGKNSPICYLPEQDPIHKVLAAKHKPMPLKFTLPSGSEMRKIRWASGIPKHLLLPVRRQFMLSRTWNFTLSSRRQ
jgi:hypothetical protein